MEKCRLELVGITYNQIENGVYAVLLQEVGGTRRIPIIIGYPEAQAIECKLQEVNTPRPLTHDMMASTLSAFGIRLQEVNIYRMPDGVFAAELVFEGPDGERRVDSRSSDGIALAIRVDAPIFTTREVLDETGFDPKDKKPPYRAEPKPLNLKANPRQNARKVLEQDIQLATIPLEKLQADMERAAESEKYEEAARLKAEIERRMKLGD